MEGPFFLLNSIDHRKKGLNACAYTRNDVYYISI